MPFVATFGATGTTNHNRSFEHKAKDGPHCAYCPCDGLKPDELPDGSLDQFRSWLHFTLESADFSMLARILSIIIMILIFISTVSFCLETIPQLEDLQIWITLECIVVTN